ncbi:MAG: hypothetical protein FWC50_15780 [Planctomycetaceae bacterium]|nr:hypothetical protein [Planctomycetaceae bacterium]
MLIFRWLLFSACIFTALVFCKNMPVRSVSAQENAASAQGNTVKFGDSSKQETSKAESSKTDSPKPEAVSKDVSSDADDSTKQKEEEVSAGDLLSELKESPPSENTGSDQAYSLISGRKTGDTDKVEVVLEAVGDVNQFLEDQESNSNKMEVLAGFRYDERTDLFSPQPGSPLKSTRYYDAARAKIQVGDQYNLSELDAGRKLIVCDIDKNTTLYSPKGSLKDDQLLLIEDLPANTLLLDHLLPNRDGVKIGDKWNVPEKALTSLLGLEVIEKHDIQAVLTSVTDHVALVELNGTAEGASLGAASTMEVKAKFQFDLKTRRITWLGLVIQEDRSLGNVGPAVTLVAKLMIKIQPDKISDKLTREAAESIDKKPSEEQLKLCYDSEEKGGWRFLHGRDWYVIFDAKGSTKLRLLHHGELISQCDIAQMGKIADSKSLSTPESFQEDLKKGLGASFGKVVSLDMGKTKKGNRELKAVIEGKAGDLPLVWTYYLLTKPDGTQAIVAFVVQKDNLEKFDGIDREIIDSLEMYSPKEK